MSSPGAANDGDARLLADIATAMRSGDSARAARLADEALARGVNHPLPYQARAVHRDRLGRSDAALSDFQKARALDPGDPMIANGVAICLGRMGRLQEAMAVFDTALVLDPGLVTTHFHMGWVLEMNHDFAAACQAYRRAVELAPQYGAAWMGLATAAEASHDWKETRRAATAALALSPEHPRMMLALASADFHESAPAAAEMRLRAALQVPGSANAILRAAILGLLADALDRQDKCAEAFEHYNSANRVRGAGPASTPFDMVALVRALTAHFARTYPAQWALPANNEANPETLKGHIFLVGFPRSGTTLLEQVLAAHPDVATLEESDALDAAAEMFLRDDAGLDRLAALSGEDLLRARAHYWARVRARGAEFSGKVLVDKLPLNTIKLPLIAKLFPGAKVLLVRRDPRDVVFSCFRRHLPVNASTVQFLTLSGAARLYDCVMTLAEVCRERLSLPFHVLRHEDLVQDFDDEMRRLAAFAGIAWSDRFRDFAQLAQARTIRSISAAQVRQGLNADGAGQWRRYARELEPVLPILQPWTEKFGYA